MNTTNALLGALALVLSGTAVADNFRVHYEAIGPQLNLHIINTTDSDLNGVELELLSNPGSSLARQQVGTVSTGAMVPVSIEGIQTPSDQYLVRVYFVGVNGTTESEMVPAHAL